VKRIVYIYRFITTALLVRAVCSIVPADKHTHTLRLPPSQERISSTLTSIPYSASAPTLRTLLCNNGASVLLLMTFCISMILLMLVILCLILFILCLFIFILHFFINVLFEYHFGVFSGLSLLNSTINCSVAWRGRCCLEMLLLRGCNFVCSNM